MNSKYLSFIIFSVLLLFSGCKDFEDINVDPLAASEDQVQTEYFINKSISDAQMDPHIAERVFVLYWKAAGRMDRTNTLPIGSYNDGWTVDYYRYLSGWLSGAYAAVDVADKQIEKGTNKDYTNNLKQVARIWRAYLLSELADNFGPSPIDGFQGVNPDFVSVQDVYHYILDELKDAVASMDSGITVPTAVAAKDMMYGFDFSQWERYGNSLRMRLAMRLSEVEPSVAKQHFEEAAQGSNFIESIANISAVPELDGWNSLTGVMSREWNYNIISATQNNLMVGLGGVPTTDMVSATIQPHVKPANYLGMRFENHMATKTNDPSAGYWMDGIPNSMDPRALVHFAIPGDFDNPEFDVQPSYASYVSTTTARDLLNSDQSIMTTLEAKYTWNASSYGSWGTKGSLNLAYYWPGCLPRLATQFRNSNSDRVFFGSWESYFLIAEAAERGWSVPMSAKAAYEKGISESFDYWGVSQYYGDYIASTDYNRVGTSVAWGHTTEAADFTADYIDGYTGTPQTTTYMYPDNQMYSGGKNNDHMNKIITQKFIAQTPWLPLETWNDQRRLGLPFFENPAIENPLALMPQLTDANYMQSKIEFMPQRLKYPSSLQNNVPEGYAQAVGLLGGDDTVWTPLWWAKQN